MAGIAKIRSSVLFYLTKAIMARICLIGISSGESGLSFGRKYFTTVMKELRDDALLKQGIPRRNRVYQPLVRVALRAATTRCFHLQSG